MPPSLPRSEAERTLVAIAQRARLGAAIGVGAFVVLARQLGGLPEELVARAFVVAAALVVAVLAHDLPARWATRAGAAAIGVAADVGAAATAVALFAPDYAFAPVLLLWPLFAAALVATPLYVYLLAAVTTIVLFAIVAVARPAAEALAAAGGWGGLYFLAALLNAELARQFRRAQRTTETAFARATRLAHVTAVAEVGEELFGFLDVLLGSGDFPAALFLEHGGGGGFDAVAARGVEPDVRARLRLGADAVQHVGAIAGDQGVWLEGTASLHPDLGAALGGRSLFAVPLREGPGVVGLALVAARRRTVMTEEAGRGIARVAAQASAALQRLRAGELLRQQRAAMSFLLDVRRAGDDVEAVARWSVRAARELAGAGVAALVRRDGGGDYQLLAADEEAAGLAADARAVLDAVFQRQLPVLVADAAGDDRFRLGPRARRGAVIAVPLHGQGCALLTRHDRAERVTSGEVELLVMLADQAALLLAKAHAAAHQLGWGRASGRHTAARVAEVARHLHHGDVALEARVIDALRLAIEGHHPHLAGSGDRAARLAVDTAGLLGLAAVDRDALYVGALVRDIGHLGVDRAVLERPGALSDAEQALVRQHPLTGETILASLGHLERAAALVRMHHERLDGSGYPDGLMGDAIPVAARVLASADAYQAMTSERSHRAALASDEAIGVLLREERAFDREVVTALARLVGGAADVAAVHDRG